MPYPPAPRVAQQLRPNGSQAACDPCRARKVACDHARPSCSRCRSKNRGGECFYSANAARRVKTLGSGGGGGGGNGTSSSSSSSSSVVLPANGPDTTTTTTTSLLPSPSDAPSSSVVATGSALSSSSLPPPSLPPLPLPLPLPHNSYSRQQPNNKRPRPNIGTAAAAYCKPPPAFADQQPPRPELLFGTLHTNLYGHFSPTIQPQQDRRVVFAQLPLPVRETCLAVLRALPGQRDAMMTYVEGGDFQAKGWLHLAAHRIVRWLQAVLAEVPGRTEQETLESVAEVISTNTSRPLRGPFPDWESWLNCFVGANTRWESIGFLWTHMESISDIMDALIPRKLVRSENCKSDQTAKYHVDSCIRLARQFTEESDLLAELYRRRAILISMVDGESGLPMWEAHGANVAYMVFLGLHTQEDTSQYAPTAWLENNRRMAAGTFVFDKLGVMLTGRPPLLSHHYYTAPLPLDLRDEDLIAGSTTLANAINSLDERGWNTDGGLYSATVMRARTMMALIRDEVIESTMSNGRNPSLEYLMDLKDRQYTLVSEFPVSLRYDPKDLETPHVDMHSLYMKIITHLEHLQNLFFIDRLLIRCRYAIRDNLLETSLGLAALALHLWIHKDQFAGAVVARSFEWIMLSYGAPAAGILCQEVLGAGEHSKDPNIGRATIIQQLSLLVGFFDWVRPSMPNAKLCANCKAIIQQVLDQCLNTSPEDALPTFPVWDLSDQPDFNFELMDTFDWLRAAEQ